QEVAEPSDLDDKDAGHRTKGDRLRGHLRDAMRASHAASSSLLRAPPTGATAAPPQQTLVKASAPSCRPGYGSGIRRWRWHRSRASTRAAAAAPVHRVR